MAFLPNKAIHPGFVVSQALEREGMTQKNLCERTGLSEKHLSQIINGEASITVETALLLENALSGSASFWINLEKNYEETKARLERVSIIKNEVQHLRRFPYSELVRRGFVEQTADKEKRVESLWRFFGVNSLTFVSTTEAVAFRRRDHSKIRSEAIAAWLRCAEIESKKSQPAEYSESNLRRTLEKLRHLTLQPPEQFSTETKNLLAKCGVSLVYVAHFPGTGVSGAVRWVAGNPLIQLSLLGAYADIFWFNLFHEIGHILLHGKKDKFVEFNDRALSLAAVKEQEADNFAGDALIPRDQFRNFVNLNDFSREAVTKFSKLIKIHPGIVEGRICHEKLSPRVTWSKPLGFRYRLKFLN